MGVGAFLSRPRRAVVRAFHGDVRSREGYLCLRGAYLLPAQERALGRSYLGLAGVPAFLACVWYVIATHGEPGGSGGLPHARFSSWSVMPDDVRILTVVAIASWVIGAASMARLAFLKQALAEQPLTDLE